ncbi:MAG: bifunctional homocysteine S-methyltransferase/methylenetetrahydrofolate reductase [Deltaproteobacteria bacterium]|nr:bifunctional homocysteine S-methyltransferase/methylenetetrahydrofolate reductase [Deltaproteobacteria bacterium]
MAEGRGRELLERLGESVLVADGAMGTMLYARGVYVNRCYDEVNLTQPDLVRGIHREYLAAGADLVETNTFGANRFKLQPFGLESRTLEINRRGAELAREVVGPRAFVVGSVGPLGRPLDPRRLQTEELLEAFAEQITGLCEGGVDALAIETQNNTAEMLVAVRAARRVAPDVPIIASATFAEEGRTLGGETPEQVALALGESVDVVGANCSEGPSDMLETVARLVTATTRPIAAMPNAGSPKLIDNRVVYLTSPEYLAEYARRFLHAGAALVGGCCGTTSAHIRATLAMVRSVKPQRVQVQVPAGAMEPAPALPPPTPTAAKSPFAAKLGRKFVVSVEVNPPHGFGVEKVLEHARALQAAGVDVVNVPDGPRASARMSPMSLAQVFRQELGLETVVHFTCRDRNLLGLQAELLGAHALGQRNVLVVTGDPPKLGDYPNLTAVYDVDSVGLVRIIADLNRGRDLAGTAIGTPTSLLVGVGANPGAVDFDREVARLAAKVEAGAEFVMTQPVYEPRLLERFLEAIKPWRVPVLVGILPLASYRNAEFLHHEVPGMQVPAEVRERLRQAPTGEDAAAVGVAVAREALRLTRGMVEGVYVMPPLGRIGAALKVLEVLED